MGSGFGKGIMAAHILLGAKQKPTCVKRADLLACSCHKLSIYFPAAV